MTKTNQNNRDYLDCAVKAAIARNPGSRAAQIVRDANVVRALSYMPAGKPDVRYLDNSLQRLRKAGEVECATGGYWSVTRKAGSR